MPYQLLSTSNSFNERISSPDPFEVIIIIIIIIILYYKPVDICTTYFSLLDIFYVT